MRLTSRNVLREIRGPFLLRLAAYTFMLVLRSLLQLSELVVRRGLRLSLVAQLVLLTLPQVVVLTIPMAFLFGTLIALGRLSADSELIAFRASGLSKWALYRPVLIADAIPCSFRFERANRLTPLYRRPGRYQGWTCRICGTAMAHGRNSGWPRRFR